MGRKGFSATTVVLIVVLVGALFLVGKAVIPPPPGPPKEQVARQIDPQVMRQQEIKQRQQMMEEEAARHGEVRDPKTHKYKLLHPVKAAPKYDPNSMIVNNSYFQQARMGEAGTKEERARYERAKAEQLHSPNSR